MKGKEVKEAAEAMGSFFGQFGQPDPYNRAVLEMFFEVLYGVSKDVSIPGSPGQDEREAAHVIHGRADDGASRHKKPGAAI